MIMYEREKREEFEKDYKINYVELAKRKVEQGDSALRPLNVQHTASKRPSRKQNNNATANNQDSAINSGALPGNKESVGKSALGQNAQNTSANSKGARGGTQMQKSNTIQISSNNSNGSLNQGQSLIVATSSNNQQGIPPRKIRESRRLKNKNSVPTTAEQAPVPVIAKADS